MVDVDQGYNLHSTYDNWFVGMKTLIVQTLDKIMKSPTSPSPSPSSWVAVGLVGDRWGICQPQVVPRSSSIQQENNQMGFANSLSYNENFQIVQACRRKLGALDSKRYQIALKQPFHPPKWEKSHLLHLLSNLIRLGIGHVTLVQHRHNGQVLLESQVEVCHRLCLQALPAYRVCKTAKLSFTPGRYGSSNARGVGGGAAEGRGGGGIFPIL